MINRHLLRWLNLGLGTVLGFAVLAILFDDAVTKREALSTLGLACGLAGILLALNHSQRRRCPGRAPADAAANVAD